MVEKDTAFQDFVEANEPPSGWADLMDALKAFYRSMTPRTLRQMCDELVSVVVSEEMPPAFFLERPDRIYARIGALSMAAMTFEHEAEQMHTREWYESAIGVLAETDGIRRLMIR